MSERIITETFELSPQQLRESTLPPDSFKRWNLFVHNKGATFHPDAVYRAEGNNTTNEINISYEFYAPNSEVVIVMHGLQEFYSFETHVSSLFGHDNPMSKFAAAAPRYFCTQQYRGQSSSSRVASLVDELHKEIHKYKVGPIQATCEARESEIERFRKLIEGAARHVTSR